MNNALIIDAVLLMILLAGYFIGAHRGLFKSLMGVIVVAAAILGAAVAADAVTEPVTDFIVPKVEEKVTEWLGIPEELTADGFFGEMASSDSARADQASAWTEKLDRWGARDRFFTHLKEKTANAAHTAVHSLVESIVHTVLFLLSFILILILLKLLTKLLDPVFDLPVLNTFNTAGGGLLGFLEAVLFIYLVLFLVPHANIPFLRDNEENTYLLKFFTTHTPFTIIASLNGGN